MNEFHCVTCGSPGADALGHFHNYIADHPFVSLQLLLVRSLERVLWLVYESDEWGVG